MGSYLYFIQEAGDGLIKIGITTDPVSRLAQLQGGNGRSLSIEGIAIGGMTAEFVLHTKSALHRRVGEWFDPAEEIVAFMHTLPPFCDAVAGEPMPDLDAEFELDAIGLRAAGIKRRRKHRYP